MNCSRLPSWPITPSAPYRAFASSQPASTTLRSTDSSARSPATVSIARSSARSRPWVRLTLLGPLDQLVDQLVEFQLPDTRKPQRGCWVRAHRRTGIGRLGIGAFRSGHFIKVGGLDIVPPYGARTSS